MDDIISRAARSTARRRRGAWRPISPAPIIWTGLASPMNCWMRPRWRMRHRLLPSWSFYAGNGDAASGGLCEVWFRAFTPGTDLRGQSGSAVMQHSHGVWQARTAGGAVSAPRVVMAMNGHREFRLQTPAGASVPLCLDERGAGQVTRLPGLAARRAGADTVRPDRQHHPAHFRALRRPHNRAQPINICQRYGGAGPARRTQDAASAARRSRPASPCWTARTWNLSWAASCPSPE